MADKKKSEIENNDPLEAAGGLDEDTASSEHTHRFSQIESSQYQGEEDARDSRKKRKEKRRRKNRNTGENGVTEGDMDSVADNPHKTIKKASPAARRSLLLFLVSLAVFFVSFGCEYIVSDIFQPHSDTEIINWQFVTGKSDAAVNNAETYNQAEKSNLISKPLGDRYVHCVYTLEGSPEPRVLKLKTEHSPMKILIDREEVYNNGYEERAIVGNSYSEIVVPASSSTQRLELFLYYPLGFNLQANIVDEVNTNPFSVENIGDNIGLLFGAVAIVIGIALAILVFALMIRSRDVVVLLRLSATAVLTGLVLFITEIANHSAVFESTIWFSAVNTLSALLICLTVNNIHSLMLEKRKATVYLSFAAPILSVLVWVPNLTVIRIGLILCAVAVAAAAIMLFRESVNWTNIIMGNNSVVQVVSVYVLLAYMFNSFASAFGFWKYSVFLFALSAAVLMFALYFVYTRNIAKNNVAEYAKGKDGSDCKYIFNAVSDIISESSRFTSKKDFVIEFSKMTLDFLEKSGLLLVNGVVRVNIAIEQNGKFVEIYASEDAQEEIDYTSIGELLKVSDQKYTVGSSFIEMLVEDDESVLIVFNNAYNSPESNLQNFISSLYNSVVLSFQSFSAKREMDDNLNNVFINLAMITEKKASGTGTHLFVVSQITELIAREMGFGDDAEVISEASILHDIGKITINREILNKRGALSPDEKRTMQQHIFSGYNLLDGLKGRLFEIARDVILEHHENYDGSGYLGKKGDEISIYARIVRVADVFDALVSKREYKEKWSYEDAIAYIYEHRGSEFDPQVVKAFMTCGMEIIDVKENEMQLD